MQDIVYFFTHLFDTADFPARWYCGKWSDFHGWLYIGSNFAIWVAYYAIPVTLLIYLLKRKDVPFRRIFLLFVAFIFFCGSTHLMEAVIFWFPYYRLNALLLFGTAVVSTGTAIKLYKILPQAFSLKTTEELQQIIEQKTSELEKANRRLKRSESQFRSLVEHNPDLITLVGPDMRLKFINNTIIKFTGQPPASFQGKLLEELPFGDEDKTRYRQHIEQSMTSGKTVFYETRGWMEGSERHYHIFMVPLNEDGNPAPGKTDALVISRDVSFQKRAEEELRKNIEELEVLSQRLMQQNRQLEDFTHIVSHNLRSPIGNLNMIMKLYGEETDERERQELMGMFHSVTGTLTRTVEDLTEIIKIRQESGLEEEELEFADTLQQVVASVMAQIEESGTRITSQFKVPVVQYPRVYLESIMLNFLTNAIKYRSAERPLQVHFRTWEEQGTTCLSCTDNGQGIDLERYGDKVFGLHKTFHHHADARGVGLFITRNQIEALGGSVSVASQPDKGTTFTVIFNEQEKSAKKLDTVFLADDDDIMKYSLQRMISTTGLVHKVETFPNGRPVLEYLQKYANEPDLLPGLLLLDLDMPIMNGWQFLEAFKQIAPVLARQIPVYVITANRNTEAIEKLKQYSVVKGFLTKPVNQQELRDRKSVV